MNDDGDSGVAGGSQMAFAASPCVGRAVRVLAPLGFSAAFVAPVDNNVLLAGHPVYSYMPSERRCYSQSDTHIYI